jgi:hypothetical protein
MFVCACVAASVAAADVGRLMGVLDKRYKSIYSQIPDTIVRDNQSLSVLSCCRDAEGWRVMGIKYLQSGRCERAVGGIQLAELTRCISEKATHILRELRRMSHKRSLFSDRRHIKEMPTVPFKDSNGATIKECRRKIPDRRISRLQAECMDEVVISWLVMPSVFQ